MFRKTILIPALLLGTALFMTASTASAHPNEHHHGGYVRPYPIHYIPIVRPIPVYVSASIVPVAPICHRFQVAYRSNCEMPLQTYSIYTSRAVAYDVAAQVRAQHFESLVWIK